MKLTKTKLKRIIKEELNKVLKEESRQINEWPWSKKKKPEPKAEPKAEADPCSYAKQLYGLADQLPSAPDQAVAQAAIAWKHPNCDFENDLPDPMSFIGKQLSADQKEEIRGWLKTLTAEKEAERKKARDEAAAKDSWETHRANVRAGRDDYDERGMENYPRIGE